MNGLSMAIQWLLIVMIQQSVEIFLGITGILYILDFFKIIPMPELTMIITVAISYSIITAIFLFFSNRHSKTETPQEPSQVKMLQTGTEVEYLGKKRMVFIKYPETQVEPTEQEKIEIFDDLFNNVEIEFTKQIRQSKSGEAK